jgi:hypothetical protein
LNRVLHHSLRVSKLWDARRHRGKVFFPSDVTPSILQAFQSEQVEKNKILAKTSSTKAIWLYHLIARTYSIHRTPFHTAIAILCKHGDFERLIGVVKAITLSRMAYRLLCASKHILRSKVYMQAQGRRGPVKLAFQQCLGGQLNTAIGRATLSKSNVCKIAIRSNDHQDHDRRGQP